MSITAETITDDQIAVLRAEYETEGDTYQADMCGIALGTEEQAALYAERHRTCTCDTFTGTRASARQACANAINAKELVGLALVGTDGIRLVANLPTGPWAHDAGKHCP